MRARPTIRDNIATPNCPVWRLRVARPLTIRAIRAEIARELASLPDHEREAVYEAKLTPLDRMLSEDVAAALEEYLACEDILAGNARVSDYAGDRVQTSRSDMSPINDRFFVRLARHQNRKSMLSERDVNALALFVAQMSGDSLGDAECALKMGLPGRHKSRAWQEEVKRCAERLAAIV